MYIIHAEARLQKRLGNILHRIYLKVIQPSTETKPKINQDAVRIMKELYDIDMEKTQYSKLIDEIPAPDIAVSMGCNVGCPFIGRSFDDNWELEDPTGKSDEEFRRIIAGIEENIIKLKMKIESIEKTNGMEK